MAETATQLRVLLADDHVTVRHGLKLLIDGQPDMKVIAEASDGAAAMQQALEMKPDVVVMDISMPGMNGLVATRTLKKAQPDTAIVTLTRHGDDAYLQELLRAGVSGYVLKQSAPTELLQAIRAAAAGGQYLDSALTRAGHRGVSRQREASGSTSRACQSPSGSRPCCASSPRATATRRSPRFSPSASRRSKPTRPTRCGSSV